MRKLHQGEVLSPRRLVGLLDFIHDDIAVSCHLFTGGINQRLVHWTPKTIPPTGVEVFGGPAPENVRITDLRTIDLLTIKRRGARRPSLFEFWPPAGLQIAIHVHRAADIDIVRKKRQRRIACVIEAPWTDP